MNMMENESMDVTLERNPAKGIASIRNKRTGRDVTFADNKPKVVLGPDDAVYETGACELLGTDIQENGFIIRSRLEADGIKLGLTWQYEWNADVVSCSLELVNHGGTGILLKRIDLLDAQVDTVLRSFSQTVDLSLGEADWMTEEDAQKAEGNPVNIGEQLFCGIDWPVADNRIIGNRLICRQYCGDTLAPGQSFRSKSLSIGACEEGKVMQGFLAHLERLRGRPTRRASFYFTWLTHSWEGMSATELSLSMAYFQRLKQSYGVHFDIYAVDAGVVETNRYYFEKYRLVHDRLLPGGLTPFAESADRIGMEFGIWIGPGGFGDTAQSAAQRIQSVVRMVREWRVSLIKMDAAVSGLLTDDPYANEHAMRHLERLVTECRKVNPNLIIINHRVSYSPYILTMLDSTLWESRETYPDVHSMNLDKPRLFTRHAQLGFGEPTYFGVYSELLEDHGVCLNGDTSGWADELVIQALGRALMLSPEVYGALFLLKDDENEELSRLMRLAESFRDTLRHTEFDPSTGDFIHADGQRVLLCLLNDSWETNVRSFTIDDRMGLSRDADHFAVIRHYPRPLAQEQDECRVTVSRGMKIDIELHPFGVALFEIVPAETQGLNEAAPRLYSLPKGRIAQSSVYLGEFLSHNPDATSIGIAERTKFAISSDPTEAQALARVGPSEHREVNAIRQAFYDKIKKQHGIAANAWDGNPLTAWGDVLHWKHLDNVWRIDLGDPQRIFRVEIVLSKLAPGPVLGEESGRTLAEPLFFEASGDGIEWIAAKAELFQERQGFGRSFTSLIVAEFPKLSAKVRYLRMHMRGLMIEDVRIWSREGNSIRELDRSRWRGNNLLTSRKPASVYRQAFRVDKAWQGRFAAVICELPGDVKVPLLQEVAVAWVQSEDGRVWPLTEASPVYPFHGWEWNTHHEGRAWVFRLPLSADMEGKRLELSLAWYGPVFGEQQCIEAAIAPTVKGYVLTVSEL